jgi:hypothetical protein
MLDFRPPYGRSQESPPPLKRISRPRAMITMPQVTPRITVNQSPAPSFVKEDQQRQQEAGDAEQNLENDMKNVHDGLSEDWKCGSGHGRTD